VAAIETAVLENQANPFPYSVRPLPGTWKWATSTGTRRIGGSFSGGPHQLSNGLLLRSDVHTLFDSGYITVNSSEMRIVVSQRMHEEFDNGKDYYRLHGKRLTVPADTQASPSHENLAYHAEHVFR
jgi:predicted restriction endonuclease